MRATRLSISWFLSLFIICLSAAPSGAQISVDDNAPTYADADTWLIQIEAGPSFAAFIGGGAEEAGTGFSGSLSGLYMLEDEGIRVGIRAAYDAYFFESIEGISGQELREQIITVGGVVEIPLHDYFTAHAHVGLGGVISRADVAIFPPIYLPVDDGGAVLDVGGGFRFYPARHVYLSGEISLNSVIGPASDLVDFNYRMSVLLGGSF